MDNLLRRRVMTEASGGGGGRVYPEGLTFFKGCNFAVTNNKMYTSSGGDNRACVFLRESINDAVAYRAINVTGWTDPAYAIPIPNGCTKMTCLCENLQCKPVVHKDVGGIVYQISAGTWSPVGGVSEYDLTSFIASGATHVSIGFRNSTDTSIMGYTIDSSTVTIYFE